MKLKLDKSVLEGAANDLVKVIAQRNSMPILSDILCEVRDGMLTMTASDTEVMATTSIRLLECDGEGRFAVLAMRLPQALGPLPEQQLTINVDTEQGQMQIMHERGETFFPIDNADEYPFIKEDSDTTAVTLNAMALREALRVSQWATALDELRKQMCGVYLNTVPEGMDVVATDGKCLVRYRLLGETAPCSVILPKKVVKILMSILYDGDATIEIGTKTAVITTNDYRLVFTQIDARYPNYNSVIPNDTTLEAEMNRAEAISSIRCVSPFCDTSLGMLKVSLENGKMKVSGNDTLFACGATGNAAVQYQGEATAIGLHGSLLLNILTNIPSEELRVRMTDPQHPLIIEPKIQPAGCDILTMVMPMRMDT